MNAYLTYAAMIGAGLYGIEHGLELVPEFKGNGYVATGVPRMPRALWEAIGELERSEAARELFGDDVVGALPQRRAGRAGDLRLRGPQLGPRALPRTRLSRLARGPGHRHPTSAGRHHRRVGRRVHSAGLTRLSRVHMRSLRHGRGVRRRLGALMTLGLLVTACGGGQASAPSAAPSLNPQADKLAQILDRGTLVGYAETDYPPQSMLVEGATRPADTKCLPTQKTGAEVTGFDNETTKLVAKDLGVEPCFVTPTWTEVTAGGWGDRWDIVYGSGSINRDRMKRLYMTQPYYATPNLFFVRADSPYQTADRSRGKQIGACTSCSHEYYLKHELEIPGVTLDLRRQGPGRGRVRDRGPGAPGPRGRQDRRLPGRGAGRAGADRRGPAAPRPRRARVHVLPVRLRRQELRASTSSPSPTGSTRSSARRQADGTLKALSEQFFGHDYVAKAAAFDLSTIGQTIP